MKCTNCGNEVSPFANQCQSCGSEIQQSQQKLTTYQKKILHIQEVNQEETKEKHKSIVSKWIIRSTIGAFVILFLILGSKVLFKKERQLSDEILLYENEQGVQLYDRENDITKCLQKGGMGDILWYVVSKDGSKVYYGSSSIADAKAYSLYYVELREDAKPVMVSEEAEAFSQNSEQGIYYQKVGTEEVYFYDFSKREHIELPVTGIVSVSEDGNYVMFSNRTGAGYLRTGQFDDIIRFESKGVESIKVSKDWKDIVYLTEDKELYRYEFEKGTTRLAGNVQQFAIDRTNGRNDLYFTIAYPEILTLYDFVIDPYRSVDEKVIDPVEYEDLLEPETDAYKQLQKDYAEKVFRDETRELLKSAVYTEAYYKLYYYHDGYTECIAERVTGLDMIEEGPSSYVGYNCYDEINPKKREVDWSKGPGIVYTTLRELVSEEETDIPANYYSIMNQNLIDTGDNAQILLENQCYLTQEEGEVVMYHLEGVEEKQELIKRTGIYERVEMVPGCVDGFFSVSSEETCEAVYYTQNGESQKISGFLLGTCQYDAERKALYFICEKNKQMSLYRLDSELTLKRLVENVECFEVFTNGDLVTAESGKLFLKKEGEEKRLLSDQIINYGIEGRFLRYLANVPWM